MGTAMVQAAHWEAIAMTMTQAKQLTAPAHPLAAALQAAEEVAAEEQGYSSYATWIGNVMGGQFVLMACRRGNAVL